VREFARTIFVYGRKSTPSKFEQKLRRLSGQISKGLQDFSDSWGKFMRQLKLTEAEQQVLRKDGQVNLRASKPTDLYRIGSLVTYVNDGVCLDLGSACRICVGHNCCDNPVILSPIELYDIVTATGQSPSEFCEFVPAPAYVQANRDFHEIYFKIDKGVVVTRVTGDEHCYLNTDHGCALAEQYRPATCKVFPFNFESKRALWDAGIKDPSMVQFYWPIYTEEDEELCYFIETFSWKNIYQLGFDFLFEVMHNDPNDVRLSAWKFLTSIPFWNATIFPLIKPGDDVERVFALIKDQYDERAIFGKLLDEIREEWD
jgi:hypothetical protein